MQTEYAHKQLIRLETCNSQRNTEIRSVAEMKNTPCHTCIHTHIYYTSVTIDRLNAAEAMDLAVTFDWLARLIALFRFSEN
jgi:hypothetical protein